jgi:hypothetical protein
VSSPAPTLSNVSTNEPATSWVAHEHLCSCGKGATRATSHAAPCPVLLAWSRRHTDQLRWRVLLLEERSGAEGVTPERLLGHYRRLALDLLTERGRTHPAAPPTPTDPPERLVV